MIPWKAENRLAVPKAARVAESVDTSRPDSQTSFGVDIQHVGRGTVTPTASLVAGFGFGDLTPYGLEVALQYGVQLSHGSHLCVAFAA